MSATGHRCRERAWLEFHHVVPYAKGGEASAENIQLRCRCHNAYEAEQDFGRWTAIGVRETGPRYGFDHVREGLPPNVAGRGRTRPAVRWRAEISESRLCSSPRGELVIPTSSSPRSCAPSTDARSAHEQYPELSYHAERSFAARALWPTAPECSARLTVDSNAEDDERHARDLFGRGDLLQNDDADDSSGGR